MGTNGGTVNTSFQGLAINLNFPAGVFSAPVNVSVGMTTTAAPAPGTILIGNGAFFIEVRLQSNGQPVTTFSAPFTLTVSYSPNQVTGLHQASLHMSYFDPVTQQWVSIPTTVNQQNRTLNAVLTHLTVFAPFGNLEKLLFLPLAHRN